MGIESGVLPRRPWRMLSIGATPFSRALSHLHCRLFFPLPCWVGVFRFSFEIGVLDRGPQTRWCSTEHGRWCRCNAGAWLLYDWLQHILVVVGFKSGKTILWSVTSRYLFTFDGVQEHRLYMCPYCCTVIIFWSISFSWLGARDSCCVNVTNVNKNEDWKPLCKGNRVILAFSTWKTVEVHHVLVKNNVA